MSEKGLPLAYLFDMDHTLIDNDCDVSWKDFVVSENLAGQEALDTAAHFFKTYQAGQLDSAAFMSFQLREFIGHTEDEMMLLTRKHFQEFVKSKIYTEAESLVKKLISQGAKVALLTATNRIIATPLAEYFGIEEILATELAVDEHSRFTGTINGTYVAAQGKKDKAIVYCASNGLKMKEICYYGDSINDRFILESVGFPVVANPDNELRILANNNSWPIVKFSNC